MSSDTTERLDVLVTQRGLAESREQAQRLIQAGQVTVNDQMAAKPGFRYAASVSILVKQPARFVSRGGDKLEAAFEAFHLDVANLLCLDVGASTGGFTDCLLQHGAARVIAVDVGKGQLHWKLRSNPRVDVIEGLNARYLSATDIVGRPEFATIDVSFISLTKVLPAVLEVVAPRAGIVALIKPQFEAGREQVGKGGVVRDETVRQAVVDKIRQFVEQLPGLTWVGVCASPLKGPAGNVEYLAYARMGAARSP
jgi:23S rRNA (cytidine1920-2'-O)/16S rRNA (cytidine1409-2'-O)-methyltransferase